MATLQEIKIYLGITSIIELYTNCPYFPIDIQQVIVFNTRPSEKMKKNMSVYKNDSKLATSIH
jgi:hypothetical protein